MKSRSEQSRAAGMAPQSHQESWLLLALPTTIFRMWFSSHGPRGQLELQSSYLSNRMEGTWKESLSVKEHSLTLIPYTSTYISLATA